MSHPIFSKLPQEEVLELALRCRQLRLEQGETLFLQGAPATEMYMVISGVLSVSCLSPDGIPVMVGLSREGSILGEMGAFDDAPRSATVSATIDATVLALPGAAFLEMVDQGHPAAYSILRWLRVQICARLRLLDERLDAFFEQDDTNLPTEEVQRRVRSLWGAVSGEEPSQ
jgi:CRP-like cAMP-binding protein